MKRPTMRRNKPRPSRRGRKSSRAKRTRKFRIALFLLLGFSLAQYLTTGTVSWPAVLLQNVTQTVEQYASRPGTGWRRAAAALENIGAAREGEPIPGFDLTGRVVRITDGDTVSILDKTNTQHKVRLYGIDTPERDQPYGKSAKQALAHWVDEKDVDVVVVETDSYGRTVGTLYREGTNINAAMVSGGHAWWYRHYAPHEHYLAAAEQKARQQGLGLWASPGAVAPWDWRRGQR
jgi:endonuclease YncB( thermonuclease family)